MLTSGQIGKSYRAKNRQLASEWARTWTALWPHQVTSLLWALVCRTESVKLDWRASETSSSFYYHSLHLSFSPVSSLSLVLFCSLTLTLLLVLSFALSAKHPRAYHKCVTGLVINIPHSIQPEVCSFFRGLPWGGTGLFQKAESWPVPGYLCTCGLEPVDRRKLTSYPTRMLLWTKKHWWQVDGLGFRLAWARQVQKQVQKQGTKFSSLNFSKTFVRGKNRIIFWAGHQESEPTCKDASSVGNLGPGLQSSVPTSNEFPLHYAYHSVRTPVMLGEKELNFYFC